MIQNSTYDAIVIGAGHNGLVAAGYLARSGMSVLVLERLDKVGGACTTDEIHPGFFGPMCAYGLHLLQGKVIDDLKLRAHGLETFNSVPEGSYPGVHPFPDGTHIRGGGPEMRVAQEIAKFSDKDARAWFEWNRFLDEAGSIIHSTFLDDPPTIAELMDEVRGTRHEEVLERILTWSLLDLLDYYFEDEHVKAFAMIQVEMDPRSAGSALCMAYLRCGKANREEDKGVPRGGMGAVTQLLATSAKSLGAEIHTGTLVEKVIVENGEAVGVQLADGKEIRASIVVSNADPKRTYRTLVDPEDVGEDMMRRVNAWKMTAGSMKFLAALSEPPDFSQYLGDNYNRYEQAYMHVCDSVEYHVQSWDDSQAGKTPTCPIMSIQMPSMITPNFVPGGGTVVLSDWVLYAPRHPNAGSWNDIRDVVANTIIDKINSFVPNFRDSILEWTLQTPLEIETRVGISEGQIRHGNFIPKQILAGRFPYRTPIRNLYMCCAGTHPGGEVSGAPGHNAAQAILRDRS